MTSTSRKLGRVVIVTAAILLVLAVLNQFSNEMTWEIGDFAIAGVLVFGAGLAIVISNKITRTPAGRAAAIAAIVLALLLIWAELAVDILSKTLVSH